MRFLRKNEAVLSDCAESYVREKYGGGVVIGAIRVCEPSGAAYAEICGFDLRYRRSFWRSDTK
jgi:hypothetical protein